MTDLYLCFSDEEQANLVLYNIDEEGNKTPVYLNTDVIGTIYKPTGETQEIDGMVTPITEPLPGWHVNIRLLDTEDGNPLEAYVVQPTTPMRIWA